ncbi:hypothetical protein BDZ89DRAFT_1158897 [Hymenopellis radicata]|nr:hypothetical protein BDZ89DRAFT_1158897 [Hymenopellis radicata]
MPAIALEKPSTIRLFLHECLVIICISYPILLFLLTLSPGVFFMSDLSLLFLLGLTALSTAVVSTLLSLAIFFIRRQCGCFDDDDDIEESTTPMFVDEKAAFRAIERVPVGILVLLEKP